ncbi:MAG: hypothetical protein IJ714_06935 [Bacteroidales bacterium]|nr:hypothetical protein [Bacteroidales bacterium]
MIIPNVIGSSVDAASVNVLSDGTSSVDAAFVNALSDDAFSAVLQELKHTLNHQKAFSCFTPLPGPWLKHVFGLPCG